MSMSAIRSSGLGDSGSEKDEKAERDEVGLERHVTLDIRHENATTCRNWRNNSIRFRKCRHIQLDSFVYLATQGLCLFFFSTLSRWPPRAPKRIPLLDKISCLDA